MKFQYKSALYVVNLLVAAALVAYLLHELGTFSFLPGFKRPSTKYNFPTNTGSEPMVLTEKGYVNRNERTKFHFEKGMPMGNSSFFLLMNDRERLFREPFFQSLGSSHNVYCSSNLDINPKGFARLFHVYIDPSEATGRKGGDSAMQDQSSVYNPKPGGRVWLLKSKFFRVVCPNERDGRPISEFAIEFEGPQYFANSYRKSCVTMSHESFKAGKPVHTLPGTVVAISREHFHNFYHNIADLYNVFALSLVYELNPSNITILFIDGHERSPQMESMWRSLFSGRIYRIGHMRGLVYAKDLLWTLFGNSSPTHDRKAQYVPYIEEFRKFLLDRFGLLDGDGHKLNCSSVRITILLRRQFGRPVFAGKLSRIMANEREVINEVINNFPNAIVSEQTFVNMTMREQLQAIGLDTDILLGMHGAGFAHILFMQPHAALIEFYNNYYWDGGYVGYARFRKLIREEWRNSDPKNELSGGRTRIPKGIATQMINKVLRRMGC